MMRGALVSPVFTGIVNDVPVRFFAPTGELPAFAWCALADVALAARLPDPRNPAFLADLRRDAGDDALRIATPDGLETVAAFWIGRAIFDGGVLVGTIDQATQRAFVRQAATATSLLVDPRRDTLDYYLSVASERQEAAMARFAP